MPCYVNDMSLRSAKKVRRGYVNSQTSKHEGFLLRHLQNKILPCEATIPRQGLAGNRKGVERCICHALHAGRADGKTMEPGWERQKFVIERGELRWHRVHTRIATSATGRMTKEQEVDPAPQGRIDLRTAELVLLGDRVFAGKQHALQLSDSRTSVYFCAESTQHAEIWIDVLQAATVQKDPFFAAKALQARAMGYVARRPVCVVTGATDGPWQQLRPGLALAAPHRSVGDRVTKPTYYANKKLRHKQQQFQADFPANKKYGMARPMPPSYSTILPPALADSPMGLQMQHSLALALARSGV